VEDDFYGYDEVVRGVVDGLVDAVRREYYMGYVGRLREIGAPSAKVVYVYLAFFQPQVALSIRRGTGLGRNTLHDALKMLKEGGYIIEDEKGLFWTRES